MKTIKIDKNSKVVKFLTADSNCSSLKNKLCSKIEYIDHVENTRGES